MKRSSVPALCVLCALGVAGCAAAPGRPLAGGSLSARFLGAWKLISTEQRLADGTTRPMPNLGPNPVGYLHYSPGKRMCAVLMKPERPAWAVRAMARASDADVASAARGFTALCGRFEVDEAKGLVTHHAEIALAPHGVGHARQRHYAFDGDRLVLRPLPPYGKGVVSVSLTWERVRE